MFIKLNVVIMDIKKIGKQIKNLRIKNDLTLDDLAHRSGLSKGFLSQLERGLTYPALDNFYDILEALGTDFSMFFRDNKDTQKIYTKEDYSVKENDDYKIEWLVLNAQKNDSEPIKLTLNPRSSSFIVEPFEGEHFIYSLKGKVSIVYGNETFEINKGETFYSVADKSVSLLEKNGGKPEVLWITTPPYF